MSRRVEQRCARPGSASLARTAAASTDGCTSREHATMRSGCAVAVTLAASPRWCRAARPGKRPAPQAAPPPSPGEGRTWMNVVSKLMRKLMALNRRGVHTLRRCVRTLAPSRAALIRHPIKSDSKRHRSAPASWAWGCPAHPARLGRRRRLQAARHLCAGRMALCAGSMVFVCRHNGAACLCAHAGSRSVVRPAAPKSAMRSGDSSQDARCS